MEENSDFHANLPLADQEVVKSKFPSVRRILRRVKRLCFSWALRLLALKFPTLSAHLSVRTRKEIESIVRAGDVILTNNNCHPLSQLAAGLLGSRWSHSAFYLGEGTVVDCGRKPYVAEVALKKFLFVSDIAILRPKYSTEADVTSATEFLSSCVGSPFNTTFNLESKKSFYCTQLIYRALKQMPNPIVLAKTSILGKPVILSTAIENNSEFELVWLSRNSFLKGCFTQLPTLLAIFLGAICGAAVSPLSYLSGAVLGLIAVLLAENLRNNEKWRRTPHSQASFMGELCDGN